MGHRRHRWIALIALVGLFFQQWAMASYLCPIEQSGLARGSMQDILAETPCHLDPTLLESIDSDLARCQEHCHPVIPSADHTASLTVPGLLPLPPSWTACPRVNLAAASSSADPAVDPHAGAPPLCVRFCSFQI